MTPHLGSHLHWGQWETLSNLSEYDLEKSLQLLVQESPLLGIHQETSHLPDVYPYEDKSEGGWHRSILARDYHA